MKRDTVILKPTDGNIIRCASHLRAGELVAFPTETVYALGAVATDERACRRIFEVKKRPFDRPLIVAVSDKSEIGSVVKSIPDKAKPLIERFFPGPLTLIFDRADVIPDVVTAGGDSVAVRIPDNDIARKLIRFTKRPVVVPSANTSDKPSPTLARHVKSDLDGEISFILDGGASEIGIESTVIDVRGDVPTVLREGGISASDIQAVIGSLEFKTGGGGAFKPQADVVLSAFYRGMTDGIKRWYDRLTKSGGNAVILCVDSHKPRYGARNVITVGSGVADYAKNLFAALRTADAKGYKTVIAEGVPPKGIGEALAVKLIRLSGGMII